MEAFSKQQTKFQKENPNAGGPGNSDMLYDLEDLKEDFDGFEFIEASQNNIELNEGNHHTGKASVIRILAIKK